MGAARALPFRLEPLFGLAFAVLVGLAMVATSGADAKYKLAAVFALAGSAVLAAMPERRIACVVLWVLIHPLSIEKVFVVQAAEGPQFINPTIAINASDGPLVLLILFLLIETMFSGRLSFRWSRLTTILALFLLWSALSFAIHANLLRDGFVTSAPLALMQYTRLLVFVLAMQSAIRSRGEVILVLLALGVAIALQTGFVALSYATGHVFLYAALSSAAGTATLQTFDSSGGAEVARATGTVGATNEQAMFHAFLTIPLIAFFVVRNSLVRTIALLVVAGSALALVLTFSRGAWVAFPGGLAVCFLIALQRGLIKRTAVLIGATAAVGMAVALLFLAQPIYERLAFGDSGATESRLRLIILAKDLFRTSPILGVGPGEFAEAALRTYPPGFSENQWVKPWEKLPNPPPVIGRDDIEQVKVGGVLVRRPLPVHNKYMLVLSELGIPGLALWLWFYGAFTRMSWRCSTSPDLVLQLVGIAGVGVAVAQLLYMNLDLFDKDKPLEIMMFVPALIAAAYRCAGRPAQRVPA